MADASPSTLKRVAVDESTAATLMSAAKGSSAAALGYGSDSNSPPLCIGRCDSQQVCTISGYAAHCCYAKGKHDYDVAYAASQAGAADGARSAAKAQLQRRDYGGKQWSCWAYSRGEFDQP
jgi:hypothetical protein